MPSFFGKNYSDYSTEYAVLNAFVVAFCGLISSLVGAYVSDYFENKGYYMSKTLVCLFAGLAGIPTIALCCL